MKKASVHMLKLNRFRVKTLLILGAVVYILYAFRQRLYLPSPCSKLYPANAFQTCASTTNNCNISILMNSYLAYRKCYLHSSWSQANYVVFDAVNGLGNRVLGFLAVTTYALVTDRVLLINWQPGDNHAARFEDLFVPLSSMDNQLPWSSQYSLARLASLIKNRWINGIEWQKKSSRIPKDSSFYFDQQILCNEGANNDQSWLVKMKFVVINFFVRHVRWVRTDQYFVPLLTRNQRWREDFRNLFPHGQIFAELSKRLLQPVPEVQSIIQSFQKKYDFTKTNVTIGVHMRSWSSRLTDNTEPFQRCVNHVIQTITR